MRSRAARNVVLQWRNEMHFINSHGIGKVWKSHSRRVMRDPVPKNNNFGKESIFRKCTCLLHVAFAYVHVDFKTRISLCILAAAMFIWLLFMYAKAFYISPSLAPLPCRYNPPATHLYNRNLFLRARQPRLYVICMWPLKWHPYA